MLLEDFKNPIIKEAIADELENLLNKSDIASEPNLPPTSYATLQKTEVRWRAAECLEINGIPQRYFLGYQGDALDQVVQDFFFIGRDTRGNLDQPGNYHIWIGGEYTPGTGDFELARRAFYNTVYPGETVVTGGGSFNDTKGTLQFSNFPVQKRATRDKILKWVNAKPKTETNTGGWYRIVPDGNLIRIDKNTLVYKKLMNFSGFDVDGKRTAQFLVNHRAENVQRTRDEILKDQDLKNPLKDGATAKLPGFKDKDGKQIIFTYKVVTNPKTGEVIEAYWVNPVNKLPIPRGSVEHEMLMAIKGKKPDGKTNLRPGEKTKWGQIWENGIFKYTSYTNKGLRFKNDPKLNAMGKLFGITGDVVGSWIKGGLQDFFKNRGAKLHDPDGKLYDENNPDSFINKMKTWRNEETGFIEMKKFLEDLAKEFEDGLPEPKGTTLRNAGIPTTGFKKGQLRNPQKLKVMLKNQYPENFRYAIYGDNIKRLLLEIEDFVTPDFKQGDVVGYTPRPRKDGTPRKPKKVVIIEMNPAKLTEVVVQDMEYFKSKGAKPQGPEAPGIEADGTQVNRSGKFDKSNLFPRQQTYRNKFLKDHPGVDFLTFLEQVQYNMPYFFGQTGTPIRATTKDIANMKEVYRSLAKKDWEDKRKIPNPDNPEEKIYDTGPGTRHNVLNRFGIIVINYTKLVNLDEFLRLLDEFKKQNANVDVPPLFTPQQFKVGDKGLFIGGKATSKQGQPIVCKIVGLKRNEPGKPGQPVPKEGTCWVLTKDNPTNGFEITTSSIMTYEQWNELNKQGLVGEFEEWVDGDDFDGDPTNPNSPNFGNF